MTLQIMVIHKEVSYNHPCALFSAQERGATKSPLLVT